MKYIIFLLLLPYSAMSQINSIKVIYGAYKNVQVKDIYNEEFKNKYPEEYDKILKEEAIVDQLKFQLLYANNKSCFFHPEYRSMEYDNFSSLLGDFGGDEIYYYDLVTDELLIYYKDFWSRELLVSANIKDFDWTIESDIKQIGEYVCYKATGEVVTKDRENNYHHKVIAWFTPKIPLKLGPMGFGNLPGLILELSIGYNTYIATKIEINQNVQFEWPKDIKKMSFEQFSKESEQMIISTKKAYQETH